MTARQDATATIDFVSPARTPAPTVAAGDLEIAAPPQLPRPAPLLSRLLPVVMAVVMIGMSALLYRSGAMPARNPMFLLFPAVMLVSVGATAVSGRGRGADLAADRRDYLDYLGELRASVTDTAAAQRAALLWRHPDPTALWTLIGGDRMWERRGDDPDFGEVRVGVGTPRLATRLIAPKIKAADHDPVTAGAARRFVNTYATVVAPVAITLCAHPAISIDGEPDRVRGLLRALLCQLAVWHGPDRLLIAAVTDSHRREHWDWLKWLPHHQHPSAVDAAGPARMMYPSLARAQAALTELDGLQRVVVLDTGVADDDARHRAEGPGLTVLRVGAAGAGGLRLGLRAEELIQHGSVVARADNLDLAAALACARRLAAYRPGGSDPAGWPELLGIAELDRFDPVRFWGNRNRRDRLRVPIGSTPGGQVVQLDIKEAADNGMGPHGLCVGATGSGKSELLRTVALGMIARHGPDELNLVLVDFKGGATFLGLEQARHVAAVITNLADEAPLVARMRDALAGEMTRRQEALRAAGNLVSVDAYRRAREAGAALDALPALFIVVDEFSELLNQHPDFVDMFVAIGRLGRSLGMHLLLASQRVDEGRLRGLESHLSYRICLKTLSGNESRMVLGASDAAALPTTPGAGYLKPPGGQLIRFQTAFVSGPCPRAPAPPARAPAPPAIPPAPPAIPPAPVRLFTSAPVGPVGRPAPAAPAEPVLQVVLDRVAGQGPPAHPVWLAPLGAAPRLDTLLAQQGCAGALRVPIGVVDRPFEQRRTPLVADLCGAAGNVAVIGAPVSGKSTTLCTLVTALAATHDPSRVQFYCLDFGGGALQRLDGLDHVGAVAGRAEPDLVVRTVAELEWLIGRRETQFRACGIASMAHYRARRADADPGCADDEFGDVFLVVDGWTSLRHDFDALEARITALAAHGLSFGVHVVVSASRWADLRPALKDQIGTRIELRLGDPADSEVDRRRAAAVPADAPGRGLTHDGLHLRIATPADGAGALLCPGGRAAPPVRLLPALIDRDALIETADDADRILVGLCERELRPVALDFATQHHLLVLGDTACGKTSALRTLCAAIVRARSAEQARLLIVDYRRSLLGVVDSEHLGGYAVSPAALSALLPPVLELLRHRMPGPEITQQQLRSRSWWTGPELYLVVDDYDLVATATGNPLADLVEFLPYAADLGLHLVVARRSGGAGRAMFEPLLAGLRDLGCMGLTMSGAADDGPLLGSVRPVPLPPGRATLSTRSGGDQRIQVAWTPPP